MYSYEDVRLVFDFIPNVDSVTRKSFIYDHSDITKDTVWVKVRTRGFTKDIDREVILKQVELKDKLNAKPGVHYVALDDEQASRHYVIGANKSEALMPIIILRDKSLKEDVYYLNITFVENDHFIAGDSVDVYKMVEISELVSQPASWDAMFNMFGGFGNYSRVKHEFLISATNEPWDDVFISTNKGTSYMTVYLKELATEALAEHNAWLATQPESNGGPGPLKDENGNDLDFIYRR